MSHRVRSSIGFSQKPNKLMFISTNPHTHYSWWTPSQSSPWCLAPDSADWALGCVSCLGTLQCAGHPHTAGTGHWTQRRRFVPYRKDWKPGRLLQASELSLGVYSGLNCSSSFPSRVYIPNTTAENCRQTLQLTQLHLQLTSTPKAI